MVLSSASLEDDPLDYIRQLETLWREQIQRRKTSKASQEPMTELEVMLNRELLVSMAAGHSYQPTSILD